MENKIYTDDFENFLKESADDFRMVASRRVWYSIYNNMHPDRKWPSIAVCFLILSSVLYIGVSTNNSLSLAVRKANAKNFLGSAADGGENRSPENNTHLLASGNTRGIHTATNNFTDSLSDDYSPADIADADAQASHESNIGTGREENLLQDARVSVEFSHADALTGSKNILLSASSVLNSVAPENNNIFNAVKIKKNEVAEKAKLKAAAESAKSWQEDYAFKNKAPMNKFRQRSSITYFVTPSSGYRQYGKASGDKNSLYLSTLDDMHALNLEAGAAVNYNISSRIRIKGGVQVNYNNYISHVTDMNHPIQTTLSVPNDGNVLRSSQYLVKSGSADLNNSTVQVAMPIGVDLRLAGIGRKISWYAGATIQPAYVVGGSAFVLSEDGKNYIRETDLLRRWNAGASLETFLSFRPSPGITLSAGPQVRYQLLSTFLDDYNYSQKMYNVGFKIGLTTGF